MAGRSWGPSVGSPELRSSLPTEMADTDTVVGMLAAAHDAAAAGEEARLGTSEFGTPSRMEMSEPASAATRSGWGSYSRSFPMDVDVRRLAVDAAGGRLSAMVP
jgi:hypothetical protein